MASGTLTEALGVQLPRRVGEWAMENYRLAEVKCPSCVGGATIGSSCTIAF